MNLKFCKAIKKQNNWNWYSAKIIYVFTVEGLPDKYLIDEYYSEDIQFFEESIILIKAQSFSQAFKFAEKQGIKNNEAYTNKYNQTVKKRFYDIVECFIIYDTFDTGIEVYSTIHSKDKLIKLENFIDTEYFYKDSEQEHIDKMHILRRR